MKFLVWLILIACGVVLINYRYKIYYFTWEWSWAQRYLGWTINAIVLIWWILIFVWAGYPFGVFDSLTSKQPIEAVSPFRK